ncbi:MAG: hypothetical protein ACXQTD_07440 [Candidatus Syntropharchaeia archaeon]
MTKKGNLIENGDFEAGNTDGWTEAPKSGYNTATIEVDSSNQKSGSYCGKVVAGGSGYYAIGYEKLFDFEEYPGYYFQIWGNRHSAYGIYPYIETYGEKEEYIDYYQLGSYVGNGYQLFRGVIPNLGYTRWWRLFLRVYAMSADTAGLFDDIAVIPISRIEDWSLELYKDLGTITSNKSWQPYVLIPRSAKIRAFAAVTGTSGTSPTLDITMKLAEPKGLRVIEEKAFSQITGDGDYFQSWETFGFGFLSVSFTVGGSNPSFDVDMYLEVSLQ